MSSDAQQLPDGVYLGFNLPGEQGKVVPHPWIEVIGNQGKDIKVFEYGPAGTNFGGIGSPTVEKNPVYNDRQENAGALFALKPPAGMSMSDFMQRAMKTGNALDAMLTKVDVPYVPALAADCDTATVAMLHSLGGSVAQFEAMTVSAQPDGPYSNTFTDFGGASIALAPSSLATSVALSAELTREVGPAPHGGFPCVGAIGFVQMERDEHGHWREGQERSGPIPTAIPGTAPHLEKAAAQLGVDALRERGVTLPPVRTLEPWDGKTQIGSFVAVNDTTVAQHIGRGAYMSYDVARDLGGINPPIGQTVHLTQDGVVREDQLERSQARG